MSNFNTFEPSSAPLPYGAEYGLVTDLSGPSKKAKTSTILGSLAIAATTMPNAIDSHHVELFGMEDARALSKLEGTHKLTNAINMIGDHMTARIDAELAKIQKIKKLALRVDEC